MTLIQVIQLVQSGLYSSRLPVKIIDYCSQAAIAVRLHMHKSAIDGSSDSVLLVSDASSGGLMYAQWSKTAIICIL